MRPRVLVQVLLHVRTYILLPRSGADGEYQVIMKQVELDLVSPADCQQRLRQTKVGRFFKLHSSFMCAGGVEGVDTCKGDGGGPLMCPRINQFGEVTNYVQVRNDYSTNFFSVHIMRCGFVT